MLNRKRERKQHILFLFLHSFLSTNTILFSDYYDYGITISASL